MPAGQETRFVSTAPVREIGIGCVVPSTARFLCYFECFPFPFCSFSNLRASDFIDAEGLPHCCSLRKNHKMLPNQIFHKRVVFFLSLALYPASVSGNRGRTGADAAMQQGISITHPHGTLIVCDAMLEGVFHSLPPGAGRIQLDRFHACWRLFLHLS